MIPMLSFIMSKVVILKDCFHLLIAVYFGKKVDVDCKSHVEPLDKLADPGKMRKGT